LQEGVVVVQAVIFDVDGTLVDTVDLHAASWAEALRHFGHDVSQQQVRRQIGKGGDQLMPVFLPREMVEQQGEKIEAFRKELFMRCYMPQARAFPGVRELFLRLRGAGQRIVLASSGKADEVERYKDLAGIADLIDAATTSDDAERSKPFPDIFQAALGRLPSLAASDAVVVGDTPYDAEAAGKAGLRTVGLLCGGFPAEELRRAGCIALYRDPADLLAQYEHSPLAPG
jgi:HAD superfamily hydrolase (TIGR01509 family)